MEFDTWNPDTQDISAGGGIDRFGGAMDNFMDSGLMHGMLGGEQPRQQQGNGFEGMPSMPQMNVMPNLPQMNLQQQVNAPVQQQRRIQPYENNFLNYFKGGY